VLVYVTLFVLIPTAVRNYKSRIIYSIIIGFLNKTNRTLFYDIVKYSSIYADFRLITSCLLLVAS